MVRGPQAERLRVAVDGADEADIAKVAHEWEKCSTILDDVADYLNDASAKVKFWIGGQTGPAVESAFKKSSEAMKAKSGILLQGRDALVKASDAVVAAKAEHAKTQDLPMDKPYRAPRSGATDAELKKEADSRSTEKAQAQAYADQEAAAQAAADALDKELQASTDVMKTVHGEPDPVPPPPTYPTAPSGPTGGGGKDTMTGSVIDVPGKDPGKDDDPPVVIIKDPTEEYPPIWHPPTENPTTEIGPTDGGDGDGGSGSSNVPDFTFNHTPVVGDVGGAGNGSGSGGGLGSLGNLGGVAGAAGGGAAAGLLGARLSGALKGGLLPGGGVAGRAGTASSAVRGIGSSARAGSAGTLGRGAGSAGATGRAGSAGRAGSGATGRSGSGAAGRGAGAKAGATGKGGKGGAGGRGAGRGAGGAGGRGGRGKDDEKGKKKELFDVAEDWVDDEGAAPGVLD